MRKTGKRKRKRRRDEENGEKRKRKRRRRDEGCRETRRVGGPGGPDESQRGSVTLGEKKLGSRGDTG